MKNPSKHDTRDVRPPLSDRLDGAERVIEKWVEEARARGHELQQIISNLKEMPWLAEGAPAAPAGANEAHALDELSEMARETAGLPDQAAVLARLLASAAAIADRAVLFVVRDDAVQGWIAAGIDEINPRTLRFPLRGETLLARAVASCDLVHAASSEPAARQLASSLPPPLPVQMVAAPLWVRDKVAAVLYADVHRQAAWLGGSIAAAATLAALALEALPLRGKHPRPAAAPRPVPATAAPPRHPSPPASAPAPAASPAAAPRVSAPAESDSDRGRRLQEARRFARLLVSEIVLYNEAEIAEGRRNKDLYPRLKEAIDRSRRVYEQRVKQEFPDGLHCFREALVSELAGGDESALGMTWP